MAYHQAHLLLLAGYSSFFVSGLVLPQPPVESDKRNDDVDCEMTMDEEMDYSEDEPIAVDEFCPRFAATTEEDEQEEKAAQSAAVIPAIPAEHRGRKRMSSTVSESHARAMSRWLLDSAISLGDRQPSTQQHQAKRPRLSRFQTSPSYMQPRLSVG